MDGALANRVVFTLSLAASLLLIVSGAVSALDCRPGAVDPAGIVGECSRLAPETACPDSAAGAVAVSPPLATIKVYTNGADADTPPGPAVPVGSTVTWTYVVTNTGWGAPCYIQVTDDRIGYIADPVDLLLPYGESRTLVATGTAVAGQYVNNATVEAWVPAFGGEGTASDLSHYVGFFPSAVPPSALLPTDTDGDGQYDDVNGNGRTDFADVVLFFNQMAWLAANEPVPAFDFTRNDRIDFPDVVWLFNHLGTSGRTFTITAAAIGPGRITPSGAIPVPQGGNVTFTLTSENALPTPHDTQSGYFVGNHVILDPVVTPTPYPKPQTWPQREYTPSYTLENVRSDHTVYGVFYYVELIA
jgi:hypothetical protein